MEKEIPLTGGRITQGVVRIGDHVHRPQCPNSDFVHLVLNHLEQKGFSGSPRFHGTDFLGREILTFMEGTVPDNLGWHSVEQCAQAARLIRTFHDALSDFPGCPAVMTVCHFDLSPCNFVFHGNSPSAIIDWDACAFGNPLDDLAYAAWMWLDIGNDEISFTDTRERIIAMLDAYGTSDRRDFGSRIIRQMNRVGKSIFPTAEQTLATCRWTESCSAWMQNFLRTYPNEF